MSDEDESPSKPDNDEIPTPRPVDPKNPNSGDKEEKPRN